MFKCWTGSVFYFTSAVAMCHTFNTHSEEVTDDTAENQDRGNVLYLSNNILYPIHPSLFIVSYTVFTVLVSVCITVNSTFVALAGR